MCKKYNDILTTYIVTITKGDEFVPTGSEFMFFDYDAVQFILKNGYHKYVNELDRYYPCTVKELKYKLNSLDNYGRSYNDDIKIKQDTYESEYDWTDHWC